MKKILMSVFAAAAMVFAGCKSIPSTGTVYALSEAVGIAAGKACEIAMENHKFSDNARRITLEILNVAAESVPGTNSTFAATWPLIVDEMTAKYVAEGKITASEADLIKMAMNLAAQGLDYWFDVRHPKWKKYQDLVSSAVHGFVDGYTYVIKPVNAELLSIPASERDYDERAFEYLTALNKLAK